MKPLRREYDQIAHSRDFDAVEQLWNLLVRASLARPESEEFGRIKALVDALPDHFHDAWASRQEVEDLLTMNPPLEEVLASRHEHLEKAAAKQELESLRHFRGINSKLSSIAILRLLRRIRNKRVHGFKDPDNPRDFHILRAARGLLECLCAEATQ